MKKCVLGFLLLIIIGGCSKDERESGPENDPESQNGAPLVAEQSFELSEDAANGTSIGVIVAEDPEGDTLFYSLEDSLGAFIIGVNSGELQVGNPSILDYETVKVLSLVVIVRDANDAITKATITLNIADVDDGPLTNLQKDFVQEYQYVTFNLSPTSFGATRNEKWVGETKLFLDGDISEAYRNEVVVAIGELNDLFTDGFELVLTDDVEESDIHVYRGPLSEIRDLFPNLYESASSGIFGGYAQFYGNFDYSISNAEFWVAENTGMPLFIHELGHVIGLGHSSDDYCGNISERSVMCSGPAPELSTFDTGILKILYAPEIEIGKTFLDLKPTVEQMVLDGFISL